MEYETIDADQINDIMAGIAVRPPKPSQSKANPPKDTGSKGLGATPAAQPTAKS